MKGIPGAATFLMKTKVVHGQGTLSLLPQELRGLGAKTPWIVTDPGLVSAGVCAEVESTLEKAGFSHGRFDQVAKVARASSVDASVVAARDFGFDSVIALGGGSALVVGKATAVVGSNGGNIRDYDGVGRVPLPPLPIVAIPTTAGSGAEVSMFSPVVDEERNLKLIIGGPNCFPHVAILDPLLLRTLPPTQAVYSGVDALAHAIEAQLSTGATPITDALGLCAMQALMNNLRTAALTDDMDAKEACLLASCMANWASGNAKLSLGHGLARNVQALFPVPYGLTIGIFLPITLDFNLPAAVPQLSRMARFAGIAESARPLQQAQAMVRAVKELLIDLRFPNRFTEKQVDRKKIPLMAAMAVQEVYGEKKDPSELMPVAPDTPVRSTNLRKATYRDAIELYERSLEGWTL